MLDLHISLLRLQVENAVGHEHRVQPITLRATEILTARLQQEYQDRDAAPATPAQAPPTVQVSLAGATNEQAARAIAAAWLRAIALRLEA
ncbi:MAG TPA: hypothetical protein VGD62_06915 [Acidobacteriaceae bacterium]